MRVLLPQFRPFSYCLPLVACSPWWGMNGAIAQNVTAATDGTSTLVNQLATPQGTQFTIESGSLSADGTNLFHSFESFSLEASEAASFVTQPTVQNVLSRVSGGEPSVLNGLLEVVPNAAGSGPNLFFMNPAGVLFGPEATVNLPANLTVTTADGIALGGGARRGGFPQASNETVWFNAVGENAYNALVGEPTGDFIFRENATTLALPEEASSLASGSLAGSIVNEGDLSLSPRASLTLLGGTVVNTGTLSAPGGHVTLVAVPAEQMVRLTQAESLLTLELTATPANDFDGALSPFTPLDLPTLLTYGAQTHATALSVNADGTVSLTGGDEGSRIPVDSGSVIASGAINVSDPLNAGGDITIVGEHVSVLGAEILASGATAGGSIRIGGDYQGQGLLPTAMHTVVDNSAVLSADAIATGDGGQVVVWADDTTQYLGDISATGGALGGNGGDVEVSGKQSLLFRGGIDTSALQGELGSLLLDPENILIVNDDVAIDDEQIADFSIFADDGGDLFTLSASMLASLAGDNAVTLEANNDIVVEPLAGNALIFEAGSGSITFRADADGNGIGDAIMESPETTLFAIERDLFISGHDLQLGNLYAAALFDGGDITLQATGQITTGNINTRATISNGMGGNVDIAAVENVTTQDITTQNRRNAGDINILSETDSIVTGALMATPGEGAAGLIELTAPNVIMVANEIVQAPSAPPVEPSTEPPLEPPTEPLPSATDGGLSPDANAVLSTQNLQALSGYSPSGSLAALSSDSSSASDAKSAAVAGRTALSDAEANAAISQLEGVQVEKFSNYFERDLAAAEMSIEEIQQLLSRIERESGNRTAIIYVKALGVEDQDVESPGMESPGVESPGANAVKSASGEEDILVFADNNTFEPPETTQPTESPLALYLFTAEGTPVKLAIPQVRQAELLKTIQVFRADLLTSVRRGGTPYLASAQQLYQWLIAPIEAEIGPDALNIPIDTLLFSMDEGLRTIPLAALHDGEQFLIENYSLGVVPSLGLLDTEYRTLGDAQVLAMGASDFEQLPPLPAVATELERISQQWPGASFLNEGFTRQNLIQQKAQTPYQVIHLATHAQFNTGNIDSSYIQLWDEKLSLGELQQLGWQSPTKLALLVLSACSTAIGSADAEMGFAGLAVAAGVRSAMASLWTVNDVGTLVLMDEFYEQLGAHSVKAEALRAAQLAMLRGNTDTPVGSSAPTAVRPSELGTLESVDLSHPYYWSGFTMIGSPW
ncbi:MAG: CHAT domain-containing protein [Cyanobacteria bacterium J06598_3]